MKKYSISFGIEKTLQKNNSNGQNKEEILTNNVDLKEDFIINDYNSNLTIGYIKEYFLTTFGQKYKYCKCELNVYYKISAYFSQNKYHLLSDSDNDKLSGYNHNKLFLIKINKICDCEYKKYSKYMIMQKFDVISKLKHSENKFSELEKYNDELKLLNEKSEMKIEELIRENLKLNEEIQKLINEDEFKNLMKQKLEDFYDIIIDINSIKNINKEGWKVKFNERGIERYIDSKSNELVTIGVLGNVNKGKSFLLSRILKVKLLDEKHTKGLCVKFPEFKGFLGRHIIMLDSEGFETPVFKNINKKEEKNYNKIELLEESKENKINKEMLDNKEFKDNVTDKIATELYLQNFIIMESDILLIVVGELTYSEQLLINKIKE